VSKPDEDNLRLGDEGYYPDPEVQWETVFQDWLDRRLPDRGRLSDELRETLLDGFSKAYDLGSKSRRAEKGWEEVGRDLVRLRILTPDELLRDDVSLLTLVERCAVVLEDMEEEIDHHRSARRKVELENEQLLEENDKLFRQVESLDESGRAGYVDPWG